MRAIISQMQMMMAQSSATIWNPADKDSTVALSSGNTVATFPSIDRCVRGTVGRATGKFYFRVSNSGSGAARGAAGIANASASLTSRPGLYDANSWAHQSNGYKLHSGYAAYGSTWDSANAELMCAADLSAGYIWFGVNGIWMLSGDPTTGINPSFTGIPSATYFPIGCSPAGGGASLTFVYDAPPSGFAYW